MYALYKEILDPMYSGQQVKRYVMHCLKYVPTHYCDNLQDALYLAEPYLTKIIENCPDKLEKEELPDDLY